MCICANLKTINNSLKKGVVLVAVSKTKPSSSIQEAYNCGQRIFGENKAQELRDKHQELPKDIEWHFIGRLQTNKVKYIAPFVSLIHSIDSEKLLAEVNKHAKKHHRIIDILLQVSIAKEETKTGFDMDVISEILSNNLFDKYENIQIRGFMGMATNTPDETILTTEFQKLHQLFTQYKGIYSKFDILSMGMSNDYPLAVANGSNMVRIGSSIFGTRDYPSK